MSEFFAIRKNALRRDMTLIKTLELKQKQMENKVLKSKKIEERRKFTAHPKRILSDSDTTASNTPRVLYNFSPSASNLDYKNYEFENRKQKAESIRKRLHERLSIIDNNQSRRIEDFSEIGDNYMVSQKSAGDKFQSRPSNFSESIRSGSSSVDLDQNFENPHLSKSENIKKDLVKARLESNYSVASKTTSGGGRKSAGSKMSSQSFCPKGIPTYVFEKKFKAIVEKSMGSIAEIRSTLTKGITPPDGDDDESRRLVRNKEFSNRFSRNYMYPLARQLQELSTSIQQLNPLLVNQKLFSTYQLVNNGLQACQNHLPTSMGDCTFNQLKILMSNIVQLCGIHRQHVKEEEESYLVEFIDTLKINAELTIQNIDEYVSKRAASCDSVLKSENSKISLTKYGEGKKKSIPKLGVKRNNADKRYSMYAMTASFRSDAPWRKIVENVAKKKFNVKSKYKTATYKHRPPVEKDPEGLSVPKLKALFPKKSGVLRPTRLNTPVNEDCIKTMVEVDQNEDTHLEKEEWENMEKKNGKVKNDHQSNKEEILLKLLQFAIKNHQEGIKEEDQSHITEILELVKKEPNVEFLNKVLDGLNIKRIDENNKENKEGQQLTLEIVKSQHSISDGPISLREKLKRKEPKITVTGDKNARLICITDDNSLIEPPPENEVNANNCQTDDAEPAKIIIRTSSETQTDINNFNENFAKNNHFKESITKTIGKSALKGKNAAFVKISRIKKCGKNIKPLDKKLAVDAIQYKLDFYRHCKNNPLYKRSTTCQPWVLMGKMSEDLLNECLLAIAREIEVNDIVERVYQSELQL